MDTKKLIEDLQAEQTFLGSCREASGVGGPARWDRLQRVIDFLGTRSSTMIVEQISEAHARGRREAIYEAAVLADNCVNFETTTNQLIAKKIRELPGAPAAGGDSEHMATIDVRDLYDYLRAAWREGQHYDREDIPDQADSWSAASDYANKRIESWTGKTAAQPIGSATPSEPIDIALASVDACPFCGSDNVDPEGWTANDGRNGPACDECGATAESIAGWNRRAALPSDAAGAPIYQIQMLDEAWGDVTEAQYEHLDVERKRIVYAVPVAPAAPDGWKLAPVAATDEMLIALLSGGEADALAGCKDGYVASRLLQASGVAERYSAMLNAAPTPTVAADAAAPKAPLCDRIVCAHESSCVKDDAAHWRKCPHVAAQHDERAAPFANCSFRHCDLPGQCKGEGACHHPAREAAPQALLSGHVIDEVFLKWSEWTKELGEAISRKNIDGFVGELRALATPAAESMSDAARLDWLDAANARFTMGWRVGKAPAGNVSIGTVIQLGGKLTPIREAIDAVINGGKDA